MIRRIGVRVVGAVLVVIGSVIASLALTNATRVFQPEPRSRAQLSIGYTGVDYVAPSPDLTGCRNWTWLQASCYSNRTLTPAHLSPVDLFTADLRFIRAQHIGNFQRLWISLDQLMKWNSTTGYVGIESQALANVDDMLHQAAAAGIKVDLVLYAYMEDHSFANAFHPEALDGNHPTMRANYLQALHDFVAHVAADPVDTDVISVMDLQSEGYYQLETYFSLPANLGRWNYTMPEGTSSLQCSEIGNTVCTGGSPGHGCVHALGGVDTTCVDVNIIEPWFKELYNTAKGVAPGFDYTISDTGRLLTTSTGMHSSQSWWVGMYPVDVYDIHLYSDTPWLESTRWATGKTLPKPWFAGEAGCASGNINCTYNGTTLSAVAQWWLDNMAADGALSVLVEDRYTAWTYTGNGHVPQLTPTGQFIASRTLAAAAGKSAPSRRETPNPRLEQQPHQS